jgi:hypothetical protein
MRWTSQEIMPQAATSGRGRQFPLCEPPSASFDAGPAYKA